ncbi:hypothetical protein QUF75_00980 [Desulfococcaceae bacterium HSG7]|nr:hypothetical protein [Desulfococcaceae bacterium HSG7]
MEKHFKMIAMVCVLFSFIFYGAALADDSNPPQPPDEQRQRPDRRGNPGGAQSLTDEQKAQAADIMSQYDASSLTAEDAKAIHNAFREAGIRPGPGHREAIEAAGFDSRVLRSLDPPPGRGGQQRDRKMEQ